MQWFASRNHIDNAHTDFNNKLLWHHNIETKFFTKSMLPQFMVSVKPFSRHHLVHLNHLPQGVQSDDPWQYQNGNTRTPEMKE